MKKNYKIIKIAFVLALSLCLCSCSKEAALEAKVGSLTQEKVALSDKVGSLTIDKATIQKKYDDLWHDILNKKQQDIYDQDAAGIALGCDWMITLCPSSLVANGRGAIKAGVTPDPFMFWFNAFSKFAIFGLLISFFTCTFNLMRIFLLLPAKKELIEAEETIENAKNTKNFMLQEKNEWQKSIDSLKEIAQNKYNYMEKLKVDIQSLEKTLLTVKNEIEQLNVMKDFLITELVG